MCPACRRHRFDPDASEADAARAVAAAVAADKQADIRHGAIVYWLLQWSVSVTLLLSICERTASWGMWSMGGPATEPVTSVLGGLVVAGAIAAFIAAYQLATWIGWGVPPLWAVLAAVPYVNVLILIILSRDALRELRNRGARMRLLGPRIPGPPRQKAQ